MRRMLAAALKLELPGHDVRLVDGGTITLFGETYTTRDDRVGRPIGFEALTEGVADEAPAGVITFMPPDDVPAAVLNDPACQNSRLRLWVCEVDADTGAVVGEPDQQCDWLLDYPQLVIGPGKRVLEPVFVSGGERLFQVNRGNCLSPAFHRSIYPGEAGLDQATGVSSSVAWAAPSARGTSVVASGAWSGGGGGGRNLYQAVMGE